MPKRWASFQGLHGREGPGCACAEPSSDVHVGVGVVKFGSQSGPFCRSGGINSWIQLGGKIALDKLGTSKMPIVPDEAAGLFLGEEGEVPVGALFQEGS